MTIFRMIKKVLLLVFMFSIMQLNGQHKVSRYDLQLGIGRMFYESNMQPLIFVQPEANFRITDYFTTNISLDFTPYNAGEHDNRVFLSSKVNLLYSPFGNYKKNDFRFGLGLTYCAQMRIYADEYSSNGIIELPSHYRTVLTPGTLGYNISIEDEYRIWNLLIFGVKAFSSFYFDGKYMPGITVKAGILL